MCSLFATLQHILFLNANCVFKLFKMPLAKYHVIDNLKNYFFCLLIEYCQLMFVFVYSNRIEKVNKNFFKVLHAFIIVDCVVPF